MNLKNNELGYNKPNNNNNNNGSYDDSAIKENIKEISSQLAHNENKLNDMLVHTSDFEDFITDDDYSIAINKAIESIKVTGGKVFISKREVDIKSTIVVPSKVTLCGIGSGETPVLSKTTIFKNFDGLAIKVVGRNVTLEDFLLTNKQGNSDSCDGILIGEGSEFNASRVRINNVIVNGMGRNGIVLQYCNGAEINAKVYYNKNDGLSIMAGKTVDVSGGNFRIDAYGNENNGITLNNTSGNTLSILTQSNKANGLQCSGWGNIIQGYSEYNSLNGVLIEGNASGNMVNLVSFGETPITYNKGALRSNNFIFIQNGDFTKGGYFRTTRMSLDSVYNRLDEVDSKVDGDIINTKSSLESLGQGLYKYDGQYGWLRLDGVTFRGKPGTGRKGLLIHDTSDNVLKYHNGENWLTTANNFFIEYITELPEATVSQRGRIVRMHGSGNDPDIIYICIRENSTYIWKKVNLI